jgi:hypothetical protein
MGNREVGKFVCSARTMKLPYSFRFVFLLFGLREERRCKTVSNKLSLKIMQRSEELHPYHHSALNSTNYTLYTTFLCICRLLRMYHRYHMASSRLYVLQGIGKRVSFEGSERATIVSSREGKKG